MLLYMVKDRCGAPAIRTLNIEFKLRSGLCLIWEKRTQQGSLKLLKQWLIIVTMRKYLELCYRLTTGSQELTEHY